MSVKNFRERNPAVVGMISIAAIAAGTIFAFFINRIPAIQQQYQISAYFADATALAAGNQVRVAGIKVGDIKSVALNGDRVLVEMDIDNGTQIPKAAFASIKLETLLGTKFIDIEAKSGPPFMQSGDVIPLAHTSTPYQIYQAANQGTAALTNLKGPQLNNALIELAKVVQASRTQIDKALVGLNKLGEGLNSRTQDLRSLLHGADNLTGLLSDKGDRINQLINASDKVLGTLAQKRGDIQTLLASTNQTAGELATLVSNNRSNVDAILGDLHRALKVLNNNVKDLDTALAYAGPSSRYFGSVFTQGHWGDIYTCALVLTSGCEQPAPIFGGGR